MKRLIAIALAAGLLAIFSTGCGKNAKTVNAGKDGEVTFRTDKAGETEQTADGKTEKGSATVKTVQDKPITQADLDAPVYPGASLESAVKSKTRTYDPALKTWVNTHHMHYILRTNDDFEKVARFYRTNLKNLKSEQNAKSGDTKMMIFRTGDDKNQLKVDVIRPAKEKRTTVLVITDKAGGSKQTVSVDTEKGSAKVKTGQDRTIIEAELGEPVYPGASLDEATKYESSTYDPALKTWAHEHSMQYTLHTTDSLEKVAWFYKTNLKNLKSEQNAKSGDMRIVVYRTGEDKNEMTVQVSQDAIEKRTNILVKKAEHVTAD